MKLTLLHKGLILVSIPLCFEVLTFLYLINAQNHLEIEAQKINQNKKINDKVNLILQDMVGIVQSVRPKGPNLITPSLVSKRAISSITDLQVRFGELETLTKDEPESLRRIQQGHEQVNLALATVSGLKAKLLAGESSDIAQIFHDSALDIEKHLQNLMDLGLFDWANKNVVERELLRKELWERIRIVLKCALALSVLLGVTGTYMLSKQLVRRVSVLTENAVLMGQGKQLLPRQGDNDELAELDENFHQAADLLQTAKQTRQEVTAMITHDLRTPLQTVLGFFEMLEPGLVGELNSLGKRLLAIATNSCMQMSSLIDNVLQLEKLRSGTINLNTSQIELNPLLEKCIGSVRLQAEEKKVTIDLRSNNEPNGYVEADPMWLEQAISNILSNAVKFSPAGSTVTISTHDETTSCTIRIADQGPGIPPDQQKLIFDRFYRMKSTAAVSGTGLGLPIAKELIELHGGAITVEGGEGQGATFALKLPRSRDAAAATKQAISADASGDKSGAPSNLHAVNKKHPLTLRTKGLILISIPLCFEITLFGMLLHLQDTVEHEANKIDHNRQINDSANSILRDLMHAGFAIRQHQRKSDETSDDQYMEWYADVQRNFQNLETLVQGEDLEQIKRGEHGVQLLANKLATKNRSPAFEQAVISELFGMMSYLAQRSVTPEYDLHGSELRERYRLLLKIALAISVGLSALGAIWYSRDIVARLNKLGTNANLLAKGEPLLEPVQGSDEIAALDKSFHSAAAQIEAATRMRQEATAIITHDLRAPLQSSRSFLEMLGYGKFGEINDDGNRLLASSTRATQRMEDLIGSVLQLEQLRSGRLQLQTSRIGLVAILDKCLGALKVLADRKHIRLDHDYGNLESELIQADAFWLEQVFVNVISNAIKYSSEHSTVSVTMKRNDHQIEVFVSDQGMGIPSEQLNLIFERYHRAESAALIPGTGLGLPIAKELIELHHGSISVDSTVGKGSTFTITLPCAAPNDSP